MRPEVLADALAARVRGLLDPLALRVAALETGGPWADRLAVLEARTDCLEARPPIPGPPGPPGPPGRDGLDGKDGPPGIPGLRYLGVHVSGKTYEVGDVVTHDGSAWYCWRSTTGRPKQCGDWQLMVKRGESRERRDRPAPAPADSTVDDR